MKLHSPAANSRSKGLDCARALAISLVLISHFIHRWAFLGEMGVELFFSLSGFLIGGILFRALGNNEDWGWEQAMNFWKRRWWRTLPNYLLFFLVWLLFHAWHGGLPGWDRIWLYLIFCQNLLFENSFFYGVSWSLCVEEWFYLVFPLLLLGLRRVSGRKRLAPWGALGIVASASVVLREVQFRSFDPMVVREMTLPRLDGICYGVALALVLATWKLSLTWVRSLALTGLLMILAVVLWRWQNASLPWFRFKYVAEPLAFALMLPWLTTVNVGAFLPAWLMSVCQKLSLWSYSIYLVHIPVLLTVYAAFGKSRDNTWINGTSKLIGLAITILIARWIFERFEVRFTAKRPAEIR